jgi:hypothetical protein
MKLNIFHAAIAFGFLSLGFAASAGNTYTPVALPSLNTDIRTWSDGSAYNPLFPSPSFSSSQTLGGVPFQFQADANGNTAFETGSLTIPVNVYGVSSVYTLINSAYGAYDADVGSVTFDGSLGSTYTVQLIEGWNIRDHYYNPYPFVNTTSDPTTTEAVWGVNDYGYAHLDMQDFTLPTSFADQTLVNIVFDSAGGYPSGEPFIAGATVLSTPSVPDAGFSASLLGLSAGVLGWFRRRLAR